MRAALDPGDHCGPSEQEKRAGHSLPRPGAGAGDQPVLAMITTTEVSTIGENPDPEIR
jgi:hypothetical protein